MSWMVRAIDALSIVLLLLAVAAFALGVTSLADRQDLTALYWLAVGGLLIKAASDMVRPRGQR
jgi:hypothetical protein